MTAAPHGGEAVERRIASGRLERVTVDVVGAQSFLDGARAHVRVLALLAEEDPDGGYALAYDAVRKALTAMLAAQGLRPTRAGGHVVVIEVARALLDPPHGELISSAEAMRRQRNLLEYTPAEHGGTMRSEVLDLIPIVEQLIDITSAFVADITDS